MSLLVERVGPEAAVDVAAVIQAAFASRPTLDPPADALAESVDSIRDRLRSGGVLAWLDGRAVGALLLDPLDHRLFLRRFGVVPGAQGHGVARALVDAGVRAAAEHREGPQTLAVLARDELPDTIRFWQRHGFVISEHKAPYLELVRPLPIEREVQTAEEMRDLARTIAKQLQPGDLVVLTGALGAGKTTFTQGLGDGLGVRGPITSPTFVISRVHPSLVGGPDLVHVDAYRLGGVDVDGSGRNELDDLDLDASLDEVVTIVEWGAGLADALSDSRLEITIERSSGGSEDNSNDWDPRTVTIHPIGTRWATANLASCC